MREHEIKLEDDIEYRVGLGWGKAKVVDIIQSPHRDGKEIIILTPKGRRLRRSLNSLRKPS